MNYILVGRDIETLRQQLTKQERYERELPKAPCIFCGETISHFNDGGVGWCLGAIVDGQSRSYLYCDQPPCVKAQEFCWEIWRCGCIPDYVESVGEFCNSCRRPRRDALPWDTVSHTDRITIDNMRALVLADVYKLLPDKSLEIRTGDRDPYVGLDGWLAPTGQWTGDERYDPNNVTHISQMPIETLVTLRTVLEQKRGSHVSPHDCRELRGSDQLRHVKPRRVQ